MPCVSIRNGTRIRKITENTEKKKLLVFAGTKFMGQGELSRLREGSCQLPSAIHRILGD